MKMKFLSVFIILFSFISIPLNAQHITLEKMWSVSEGFIEPESAAYDPITGKVFITNVNGYAKNKRGFISRMDAFGDNIEEKWIAGLNAPTGIVFHNGNIIFADYDHLKVANAETGEITASYKAPDRNPSLNDVAVAPDGTIYVSASLLGTVYKLTGDTLTTFIQDKKALKDVNGLFIRNSMLITGGENLHVWRLSDGAHSGLLVAEDSPIKDIDGIAGDKLGNLIISLIDDDRLWIIKPDGVYAPITQSGINPVDFYLHPELEFLFTPTIDRDFGSFGVSAFRYKIHK